jgi:hypothetical protein
MRTMMNQNYGYNIAHEKQTVQSKCEQSVNGFLLCGECGGRIYSRSNDGRYYYVCHSKIPRNRKKRESLCTN